MVTITANPAPKIEMPVFSGRYRQDMGRYWELSQKLFGFTPAMAEKFANHAAKDAADALKGSEASLKVGKTNKDNQGSISEAAKAKKVSYTNALNLVRAIDWTADALKNGISYGKTQWVLKDELQDYARILAEACDDDRTEAKLKLNE